MLYVFGLTTGIAIIALVLLLTGQLFFLARHTRIHRDKASPSPRKKTAQAPKKAKKPPKEPDIAPQLENHIDPNIFTRFQKNLTESEELRKTAPADSEDAEKDVVLSISSQGRKAKADKLRKTEVPKKSPQKQSGIPRPAIPKSAPPTESVPLDKVPVAPLGSLFDDVHEPLGRDTAVAGEPAQSPKTDEDATAVEKDERAMTVKKEEKENVPLTAAEILTSDDLKPNSEDSKAEAGLLVSNARIKFENQEYEGCLETVRPFLADKIKRVSDPETTKEMIQLKGDCEFALKHYEKSSKTWQNIFKKYIKKERPEFLPLLEQLIDKFVDEGQQQYAVHFLFTALNEYRQVHKYPQMDQTYDEIENAYQQMEDWSRLIQTYQNHLSIKKTLKDFDGQLDLLDHLGKILYDQGDAEGSKKCYEQRLAIESKMTKS